MNQPTPIRKAGLEARRRSRLIRRMNEEAVPRIQRAFLSPEHYHIGYQIVGQDTVAVNFKERFEKGRDAYARLKEIGDEGEPNTEWYDNGQIRTEMRMHDRAGTFQVLLSVMPCLKLYHPGD